MSINHIHDGWKSLFLILANICPSYHSHQLTTQQTLPDSGHPGQGEKVGIGLNSAGKVSMLGKGIPHKRLSKTQRAEHRRKRSGSDKNPGNGNAWSQTQLWKGPEGPKVTSQTASSWRECRGEPRRVREQSCFGNFP